AAPRHRSPRSASARRSTPWRRAGAARRRAWSRGRSGPWLPARRPGPPAWRQGTIGRAQGASSWRPPARPGNAETGRGLYSPAMRRTKIVATIGPACRERPALERLMRAGVDVVRLNFSHGEPEEHLAVMRAVREIAETIGRPIAVLQDLGGPKIRTGRLGGGQPVALSDGSRLVITTDDVEGSAARISTTYEALPADVAPGDRILLDDGNLELRVERTSGRDVECTVVHGGLLGPHKGM